MVNLKIDGKDVQVEKGATILEAAAKIGVYIPTLCYLKKVSPTGACRVCVVEVEGFDKLQTACNTPAQEGIVVTTQSERIAQVRRHVVELLLVNHPLDCPVCDAAGECDLQNICYEMDVTKQPFAAEDVNHATIDEWPLIQQVPNRCILCEKCVKVCHEVVGSSALFVNDKGDRTFIDKDLAKCEFCGNCVSVCPTGTMISKPFKFSARGWELQKTPSVCTTCGSQCEIEINHKNNKIYRITSADETTVNSGNLCVGGFFGYGYVNAPERLQQPLLKKNGVQGPVDWDEALAAVADKVKELQAGSGAQAIAGLASPRLTNEENYLFQRLFRSAIGSNNIDSEARFGALRAAKTLQGALGLVGASAPLSEISKAKAVLAFGCDVTAEAPALDWQIEEAFRKNDAHLVVANMRSVKLAKPAHSFLNYRPGSAVLLAQALAAIIFNGKMANEAWLKKYVKNFDELKATLKKVDVKKAAEGCGLTVAELEDAAAKLGQAESVAVIFGADLCKSDFAEEKVAAIANLALVCGALEKGGLYPVDEKGNTQGLLDAGVYPEALPGRQDYKAAAAKFEKVWGGKLPEGGKDAVGILDGIEKGEIKLLYLVATNPLVSFPESARWRKALEKLDLLVVQDIFNTELTAMADVVLPGTSFAEKTGSVTALDNRVSCLGKALQPVGGSREDFDIFAELYQKIAKKGDTLYVKDMLIEMNELTGLYSEICLTGEGRCRSCQKVTYQPQEKALAFTPVDGKPGSSELQLLSGKILFQFGTMTTFAPAPREVAPGGYFEINVDDAKAAGIADGGKVSISSSLGSLSGKAKVTADVPKGLVFAPNHFADLNVQQLMPQWQNRVAVKMVKA